MFTREPAPFGPQMLKWTVGFDSTYPTILDGTHTSHARLEYEELYSGNWHELDSEQHTYTIDNY